ncbi:hypothetical protein AVEN_192383-1 [Araneus ventricosus]|uniref:Uncharacterized protein n=1 Tax=Araneus ventricosus TaxID=182803 RepID=A0A4Y2H7F8_ARAVE|nr:hypothetical protein AVEN_192383-1 [Araneus ventricosus]
MMEIKSADNRTFVPHITIGKINIPRGEQTSELSFKPEIYGSLKDYFGYETISGIQLISYSLPRDQTGYYGGETLLFRDSGYPQERHLHNLYSTVSSGSAEEKYNTAHSRGNATLQWRAVKQI